MIGMLSQPNPLHPPDGRQYDEMLSVEVRRRDRETVVITLRGEADLTAVPVLREVVDETAGGDVRRVIVNLDDLTFLDAATLGWLVETRKRLSGTGATVRVSCHSDPGRLLLTVTGLDFMLD